MLHEFYIQVGGRLHHLLMPFLRFGKEKRVRIIVISDDRQILLVRNWFGYQHWSLPGGGVKKGESSENAVIRELHEETGLSIEPGRVNYLKSCTCHESSVPFEADVYYATVKKQSKLSAKKSFEIIERKWHPLEALPEKLAIPVQDIVKEVKAVCHVRN